MPNPLIPQGILNRVLTNIVVAAFPALGVTAPYFSKSLTELNFDGPAVEQIPTCTGIVNSNQPFLMAELMVNILRSQSLVKSYYDQWQNNAQIGTVTIYADTPSLDPFTILDCSILDIKPGAFDGVDPTTKVTIKGTYPINAAMWQGT